MKLWEVDTGFVRVNLFPVNDMVLSCALSRISNRAAIGTTDSRVCLYRVGADAAEMIAPGSTIEPTYTLSGHQHKVYGVAFTSDAERLASGSMDETVRLWDTARGKCLRVIAHEKPVFSVKTSPVSPNFVLSAPDDMTMVMHDLRAQDAGPPIVFRGHTATLWTCDMSYDETHLVSSGRDGQVLLWDKRNPAAPLRKIGHHDAPVHWVEFMPDANRVLSCSRDSTWRMWSCEPRDQPEMLAVVEAHAGHVFKVSYNAARSQVLSFGADGDIKLWKLHE
jgi:WD40 repeat protein